VVAQALSTFERLVEQGAVSAGAPG